MHGKDDFYRKLIFWRFSLRREIKNDLKAFFTTILMNFFSKAVRADRMRGGRNKFGPMYKRDRARKLQILRQRQLALQALRGSIGGSSSTPGLSEGAQSQLSPTSYPSYTNMHIKQEIQIPQVKLKKISLKVFRLLYAIS